MKDNTDSGQFLAIQNASAYCYDHPEITESHNQVLRRMDKLVGVLQSAGFQAGGSFFLYMSAAKAAVKLVESGWNLKTAKRSRSG